MINIKIKFIRFVLVGILNTAFGIVIYWLFLYMGLNISLSLLLATILGVLFNFKTIGFLVFKNRDNRLIFKFSVCYIIIYFINLVLIKGLIYILPFLNNYLAGMIVLPLTAIMSFNLQSIFVFRETK